MGLGTGLHHAPAARPRRRGRLALAAAAAVAAVVAVGMAGLWALRDDGGDAGVVLVPAGAAPDDPWFADLDAGPVAEVGPASPADAGIELADLADPVPLAGGQVTGTAAGLYAGRRDEPACDLDRIGELVGGDRADDWFDALGRHVDNREGYVADLTAVHLRFDTRVVEQAPGGPRPALLQAGTPVLIDGHGVPRVRCAGGQPLSDPEPASGSGGARNRDEAWAGFDPAAVVVVAAGPAARAFDLADLDDPTAGDADRGHFAGRSEEPCDGCHELVIEIAAVSGTPARMAYGGVVRQLTATHTSLTWGVGVAPPGDYPYTITHDTVLYRTMESAAELELPSTYDDPRYEDEELAIVGFDIMECVPGDVTVTVTVDDVEVETTTVSVPCGDGLALSYALG
jgi:hypothetical protein